MVEGQRGVVCRLPEERQSPLMATGGDDRLIAMPTTSMTVTMGHQGRRRGRAGVTVIAARSAPGGPREVELVGPGSSARPFPVPRREEAARLPRRRGPEAPEHSPANRISPRPRSVRTFSSARARSSSPRISKNAFRSASGLGGRPIRDRLGRIRTPRIRAPVATTGRPQAIASCMANVSISPTAGNAKMSHAWYRHRSSFRSSGPRQTTPGRSAGAVPEPTSTISIFRTAGLQSACRPLSWARADLRTARVASCATARISPL